MSKNTLFCWHISSLAGKEINLFILSIGLSRGKKNGLTKFKETVFKMTNDAVEMGGEPLSLQCIMGTYLKTNTHIKTIDGTSARFMMTVLTKILPYSLETNRNMAKNSKETTNLHKRQTNKLMSPGPMSRMEINLFICLKTAP